MLLVIDANVALSALTADNVTDLVLSPKLKLVAPELIFIEIGKHKAEIKEKSKLSDEGFETLLALLEKRIEVIPMDEFIALMPKAEELLGKHRKDAPYVALALKLGCPFWSYEKKFRDMGSIKSLTTADVAKTIRST